MALPKRRHSHSRTHKRKANWRLSRLNMIVCVNCRGLRLAHRACPSCGQYAGGAVVTVKQHLHRGRG